MVNSLMQELENAHCETEKCLFCHSDNLSLKYVYTCDPLLAEHNKTYETAYTAHVAVACRECGATGPQRKLYTKKDGKYRYYTTDKEAQKWADDNYKKGTFNG